MLGIEGQRFTLVFGTFFETVFVGQFATNQMIDLRIGRPVFQGLLAMLFFRCIVAI